jgi:hypothetical protein
MVENFDSATLDFTFGRSSLASCSSTGREDCLRDTSCPSDPRLNMKGDGRSRMIKKSFEQ